MASAEHSNGITEELLTAGLVTAEEVSTSSDAEEERESPQGSLPQDVLTTSTFPEKEFGSGTLDCNYQPRVWKDMGKLFQQEILSDVMLMAEGKSIPCHKFLLVAASEYFYSKLLAASDAVDHNLLEIENISFQTLKLVVNYMYTGHINITVENSGDVLPACTILKLSSAYDTCETFLLENTHPMNCIGLYRLATEHDAQRLREKAREVMLNNLCKVVSGPEFQDMSADEVEEYIQNENLRIPNEDPVYEAVISWIRYKPEERTSYFSQLIRSVRLRYCSSYCLKHIVPKESLMEASEHQKRLVSALKHQDAEDLCWEKLYSECVECNIVPRKGYQTMPNMIIIGDRFNPCGVCWQLFDNGWEEMEQCRMPTNPFMFSACLVKEGIVISGGRKGDAPVSQCWLFSVSTYQWNTLPDLNTARLRHASVCVGGQVYVIGGEGSDKNKLSSVENLQKNSGVWDIVPDLPAVVLHPMAAAYRQCVYVFGGVDDMGHTAYMVQT